MVSDTTDELEALRCGLPELGVFITRWQLLDHYSIQTHPPGSTTRQTRLCSSRICTHKIEQSIWRNATHCSYPSSAVFGRLRTHNPLPIVLSSRPSFLYRACRIQRIQCSGREIFEHRRVHAPIRLIPFTVPLTFRSQRLVTNPVKSPSSYSSISLLGSHIVSKPSQRS